MCLINKKESEMDPRQQLRTYLDILSEQDFVSPTEQEFHQYVQNFQAGNQNIDYAIRNLAVLDEEQIRIIEDYEIAKEQGQLSMWANKWKPQLSDQEIGIIQNALEAEDPWNSSKWQDIIRNVLEPHISNKDLYQAHDVYWEEIMFAAGEGRSYEEFVAGAEEMGL